MQDTKVDVFLINFGLFSSVSVIFFIIRKTNLENDAKVLSSLSPLDPSAWTHLVKKGKVCPEIYCYLESVLALEPSRKPIYAEYNMLAKFYESRMAKQNSIDPISRTQ